MTRSIFILCMLAISIHTYADGRDLETLKFVNESEVSDTISVRRKNVTDIYSNYAYTTLPKEKGYDHIYNAGTFIRKGYSLELAFVPFAAGSGILLGFGYANESKLQKGVGYLLFAGALGTAIASLTFHFKSGKELQMGAGYIKYT